MALRNLKPRGTLDRSATADLFRHTLSRIPSVYGRLLYLSALRDPNTGTYRHYGLAAAFGRDQSISALQTCHTKTFREWLKLPLRDKHADLVSYLETLEDPKGLVVDYWTESQGYLGCVPESASKAEYTDFVTGIERLLGMVSRAAGGASRDPKTSRRPRPGR
jgi:hypothetical protein